MSPTAPLNQDWLVHGQGPLQVWNKPAGLLSQPGLGPDQADSLISRVQLQWPSARLVHRLDRDTSGLLLVALTAELHRALSGLFAARQVEKTYVADVVGVPPASRGRICLPLARRSRQPPLYGVDAAGRPCRTDWQLQGTSPCRRWSRLELSPRTGRSHQLRVHLQAIGHPMLGDPLYGDPGAPPAARLHLHASALAFVHPLSGEPLRLVVPCPF